MSQEKMDLNKLPCLSEETWTDCGYEYDCGYGAEIDCEECVCSEHGSLDPRRDYDGKLLK